MPPIYEGCCSTCPAVVRTSDGTVALYADEPDPAKTHPDDPHLRIVPHPGGDIRPKQIWTGRLVHTRRMFCRDCGREFEVRRLTANLGAFGCSGCLVFLSLAAAVGVAVGELVGNGWVGFAAGLVVFSLLVVIAEAAVERLVRWWHAERARRVDTPAQCPACGSRNDSRPGALREPIPCGACGRGTVTFRFVAKS
jgi:hypothetical protein